MGNEHELKKVLKEYSAFLDSSNVPGSSLWAELLRAALSGTDSVLTARTVVSFFGGMGSINDIVFPSGSLEKKTNDEFGERLYQLARVLSHEYDHWLGQWSDRARSNPEEIIRLFRCRAFAPGRLAWSLVGVTSPDVLSFFSEVLEKHEDTDARWAAAEGLSRFRRKSLEAQFIAALADPDWRVKSVAIHYLAGYGSHRSLPALRHLLTLKRVAKSWPFIPRNAESAIEAIVARLKRKPNPLLSSKLPSLKWLDRLEKLAAVLQKSDPLLWGVFEPARQILQERIMGLDHWGKTNILHQTADEVLPIVAAEIPKTYTAWVNAAEKVWGRAPEDVLRIVARERIGAATKKRK